MAEKPHIWKKGDAITAKRLNTISCAVSCLMGLGAGANMSCKSRATSGVSNYGPTQETVPPIKYKDDTSLYYRHPYLGTADLVGDERVGFYATPPRVVRADGREEYSPRTGCNIASCGLGNPTGASNLYIEFCTNNVGLISGSPVYTWCQNPCTKLFGLSRGAGRMQFPVAKVIRNPKYPCEKVTLNNNGPVIPFIADDASYLPPYITGQRVVQGEKWVDGLLNAVIPVRGLNNWGGVKLLGVDTDGLRRSVAVEASIEMYGIAAGSKKKEHEEETYPLCLPCAAVGSGPGQWPSKEAWLYQ